MYPTQEGGRRRTHRRKSAKKNKTNRRKSKKARRTRKKKGGIGKAFNCRRNGGVWTGSKCVVRR